MEHRSYMGGGLRTSIVPLLILLFLPNPPIGAESPQPVEERYLEIIRTLPHDPTSFTQGLEVLNDSIIESSGLYGQSRLTEINSQNGEIIRETPINETYFGEGITIMGKSIIMLTWKSGVAIEFEISNFTQIGNFSFEGEGWGICFNGKHLVTSNGTSELSFRDPISFEIDYTVEVTWDGHPVLNLNELECVGGNIFANVWMQDIILSISSTSGMVDFFVRIPVSITSKQGNDANEVLNGIAYDPSSGGFWITGKNWTELYLANFTQPEVTQHANSSLERNPIQPMFVVLISLIFTTLYYFSKKKDPETPNFKDSHH